MSSHVHAVVPAVGRRHVVLDVPHGPSPAPLGAVRDEQGGVVRLLRALLSRAQERTKNATPPPKKTTRKKKKGAGCGLFLFSLLLVLCDKYGHE